MQKSEIQNLFNSFIDAFDRGVEAFREAGAIMVQIVDNDLVDDFVDFDPRITPSVIETFERIGRGQLYYQLTMSDAPGPKALAERCSYAEQVKYSTEPIDLVIRRDGKTEILKVSVWALTEDQAKQVFTARSIRDHGAQVAYLESKAARAALKPTPFDINRPYTVRAGKVYLKQGCILEADDLAHLLNEVLASKRR